jgi:CRISPR-associated protein Cmr5
MGQTIQQLRAKHALDGVRKAAEKKVSKTFTSYASGFPFMIHNNGLGQAVAFYKAKKEDEYKQLLNMLSSWLTASGQPFAGRKDLLEAITQSDVKTYMAAQTEAILYLDWVKKFAKAVIGEEAQDGD